jgi:hypothetical protein
MSRMSHENFVGYLIEEIREAEILRCFGLIK